MKIKCNNSVLKLSDDYMSITSYKIGRTEFCAANGEKRPIFTLKLLDEKGNETRFNSFDAEAVKKSDDNCFLFERLKGNDISAKVSVNAQEENIAWHITVENNTQLYLEWVEFPQITLAGALKGDGGEFELFWPAMEGQIIETTKLRKLHWSYKEIGGQSEGYSGFYPGSCPMQFMAYYNDKCGLYFAAHDGDHTPKTVEFHDSEDGLVLEYRLFTGGARGVYDYGFDMIFEAFCGDWHDAADIYRTWMEKNTKMPPKLYENKRVPKWMRESPIVVLYPIKGTMDRGDMTPNMYYPYANILPITKKFNELTESKVMALPMHWEGTAPWATPYVWPPFGGEKQFTEFVSEVHKQGNLVGVYCSGIGWTTESFLNPELDFSDKYDEKLICRTSKGTIEQSRIVGEPIRHGYDMCPESPKVADIVSGEVTSIAKSGCDYAQYFDQNLGGESCFCYSHEHGHPSGPGLWQNKAMERIFKKVYNELDKMDSDMIIGCEGAASEPFIGYLPFNDLRYNIGFFVGKPTPAYSYLFHEYINNFMGNQNTIDWALDLEKDPECLLYRIAYSFVSGDMMTVCLGKDANIIWGWDTPWEVEPPKQEPIYRLMKNLNMWRREYKEYLHFGRMIKPLLVEGTQKYTIYLGSGNSTDFESLLTSRWQSKEGKEGQIIVNFLEKEQKCRVNASKLCMKPGEDTQVISGEILIPPLSAVWVE